MVKMHGDITRLAVEQALPIIAKAKLQLSSIVFTGPDKVLMSREDVREEAINSPSMLKYAQSADTVDNDLLERMLLQGQIGA